MTQRVKVQDLQAGDRLGLDFVVGAVEVIGLSVKVESETEYIKRFDGGMVPFSKKRQYLLGEEVEVDRG